jgi:tetratricopeptide (TPR) repeat protein
MRTSSATRVMLIFTALLVLSQLSAISLNYDKVKKNLKGLKSYEQKDYDSASMHFGDNVIAHPHDGTLHFNLGNSFHKSGEFDAALNEYERALRDPNFKDKSLVYHNIGNTFFEQDKYPEALESFRNAVLVNPKNADARYNYELTKLLMQRMQNENQSKSDSGEDNDNEEKQQQKQSPAEKSDSQDGEDAQVTKNEENDDGDQPDNNDPQQQKKLEEAEKMLRALMARERDFLEKEKELQKDFKPLKGRFW